jgi:hypothetical protein
MILMTATFVERLAQAWAPLWRVMKPLFTEHHFLTILCGFCVLLMTISSYPAVDGVHPDAALDANPHRAAVPDAIRGLDFAVAARAGISDPAETLTDALLRLPACLR